MGPALMTLSLSDVLVETHPRDSQTRPCASCLLWYTIFTYQEGLENPAEFSDDMLIDNLYNVGANWSPAYFRGEWDKEMMIAAVAFDKEGNPSPVYRERFVCTREGAGNAQEFVDYYLGGITTYVAKKRDFEVETSLQERPVLAVKGGQKRGVHLLSK